ncbi:MAG: aminotransferase [Eubacteriales bacterium]|nr:aminotransferase [Eubacteriales bacterium]
MLAENKYQDQDKVKVYVECDEEIKLPTYGSEWSAGLDIYLPEPVVLRPGEKKIIPSGLKLAIPAGTELQLRPRSGLSLKSNLKISNSPGTIDADYRDEIGVIAENTFRMSDLLDEILLKPELKEKLRTEYQEYDYAEYSGYELKSPLPLYLDKHGNPYGTIYLAKGERIAQLVLGLYLKLEFEKVSDIRQYGADRGGGFGSTGR